MELLIHVDTLWENLVKLYLFCLFRGSFDANLKRDHSDTNSTGKDKLNKAQLLSLSIFKA